MRIPRELSPKAGIRSIIATPLTSSVSRNLQFELYVRYPVVLGLSWFPREIEKVGFSPWSVSCIEPAIDKTKLSLNNHKETVHTPSNYFITDFRRVRNFLLHLWVF